MTPHGDGEQNTVVTLTMVNTVWLYVSFSEDEWMICTHDKTDSTPTEQEAGLWQGVQDYKFLI